MLTRPVGGEEEGVEEVDKDLQLLLSSSEPLFQSRNPAVSSSSAIPEDI
jgi:AP-3 complex subunit beta